MCRCIRTAILIREHDAEPYHWTERGRAKSVANADVVDRPRRSVPALAHESIRRFPPIVHIGFRRGRWHSGFHDHKDECGEHYHQGILYQRWSDQLGASHQNKRRRCPDPHSPVLSRRRISWRLRCHTQFLRFHHRGRLSLFRELGVRRLRQPKGFCHRHLITSIHGDDPVRLYAELNEVVDDVVLHFEAEGRMLPPARTRPMQEVA